MKRRLEVNLVVRKNKRKGKKTDGRTREGNRKEMKSHTVAYLTASALTKITFSAEISENRRTEDKSYDKEKTKALYWKIVR